MRLSLILLPILLMAPISAASAFELFPFATRNESPLVAIHGLPPAETARLTPAGRTDVRLEAQISSHFTRENRSREAIFLDGETHRFSLSVRRGIGPDMEVGVEIPWVHHGGGFLDSFIEGWHDTFGLPQGGRDEAPRNRLQFTYSRDGVEKLRRNSSAEGLGDVRLTAAWRLPAGTESSPLALRAALKLPTGESDRLLGSGATALSLQLAGDLPRDTYAFFGSAGVLLMTEEDVLPDRQRHVVGFGSLGAAWRPFAPIALKIQVDGHTAFYDSDLPQLGESVQLVLGGTVALGEATTLDLGVVEDIVVDTAPDVVFHLALRTRF